MFHTDSQSVFGDSYWPNDRMQIFGTYTLAFFLEPESPSVLLYSLSDIYYVLKKSQHQPFVAQIHGFLLFLGYFICTYIYIY